MTYRDPKSEPSKPPTLWQRLKNALNPEPLRIGILRTLRDAGPKTWLSLSDRHGGLFFATSGFRAEIALMLDAGEIRREWRDTPQDAMLDKRVLVITDLGARRLYWYDHDEPSHNP